MGVVEWTVAVVGLQRLAELGWSRSNEQALFARGAVEVGARHYPFIVLLHTGWLLAILGFAPRSGVHTTLLAAFVVLQVLRLWIITTLGPYWTTRVLTVADAPRVRRGPYRWLDHPNYWVVVGEIALLPAAFGAYTIAVVFSVLNAILLLHRIRVEEKALEERREE